MSWEAFGAEVNILVLKSPDMQLNASFQSTIIFGAIFVTCQFSRVHYHQYHFEVTFSKYCAQTKHLELPVKVGILFLKLIKLFRQV